MNVPNEIAAKLKRAALHAETAHRVAKEFLESNFYTMRVQSDGDSGTIVIETVEPMPVDVGIIVGESAHQLRSALDHLMWMLAWPVGKQENQVEFPIMGSRAEFTGRRGDRHTDSLPGAGYKMPRVARGVRAVVESLQPYNSRKCAGAESLGVLRALSNWDKHRSITTSAAAVRVTDLGLRFEGDVRPLWQHAHVGLLKPGAILGSLQVSYGPKGGEVYTKPILTIEPVFDDDMPETLRGHHVTRSLTEAGLFISSAVLPSLLPFL